MGLSMAVALWASSSPLFWAAFLISLCPSFHDSLGNGHRQARAGEKRIGLVLAVTADDSLLVNVAMPEKHGAGLKGGGQEGPGWWSIWGPESLYLGHLYMSISNIITLLATLTMIPNSPNKSKYIYA